MAIKSSPLDNVKEKAFTADMLFCLLLKRKLMHGHQKTGLNIFIRQSSSYTYLNLFLFLFFCFIKLNYHYGFSLYWKIKSKIQLIFQNVQQKSLDNLYTFHFALFANIFLYVNVLAGVILDKSPWGWKLIEVGILCSSNFTGECI